MEIIFKHTEDNKYHIYKTRSRAIAISYWLLTLVSFILASYIYNTTKNVNATLYPFLLFLILIFGGIIDMVPMYYRQMVTFYSGRNVILQGNWLFKNNWELKLEKK